jgi:NAD(P)-dependent dehydrogenase (short-subunit alcohol dehydrogenase family)
MKNSGLENKNVLITGGVEGIGYECAKKFQELGSNVIVTCLTKKSYEKFLDLEKTIKVERLDITNDISIEELKEKINKLDILINNATLFKGGIEYRIENFADVVNVNLMGAMRVCHTFLPKLALTKGNIINIGSVSSKSSMAYAPSYSATKSAIESLTKSMAACWAEHNVRVNCVAPGMIEGKTLDKLIKEVDTVDYLLQRIPLKRYGSPLEVAEAVLFLSSEKAAYITGTTIFVDGGYSIN